MQYGAGPPRFRLVWVRRPGTVSGRDAVWLDARETLATFMNGQCPNRERLVATMGSVFDGPRRKRYDLIVRGCGEMVDLLWKDGNSDGALLRKGLWNELAVRYSYSLLCGSSLDNFLHEAGSQGLKRVGDEHTRALPLETYGDAPA